MLANVLNNFIPCDVALFFPGSVLTRKKSFLIRLLFFAIYEKITLFNAVEANQQNDGNSKCYSTSCLQEGQCLATGPISKH